jgi:Tol biopolymer transport system component
MVRYLIKKAPRALIWLVILLMLPTYISCKLSWGDDPVGAQEDDTAFAGDIERVSVASGGGQANGNSDEPEISSDGFVVAFISEATNLVAGDTNGEIDIFVHDRATALTERVSIASGGAEGDDEAFTLSLSSDGNFVAFGSFATNLVAGDTNGKIDVFVHDRVADITERVSIATDTTQADGDSFSPAISSDGQFVAFQSDATNLVATDTNTYSDIFVHDRQTGETERISVATGGAEGNGDSFFPAISADGRFVAFSSEASNLVAGDTNNKADIFVHDRLNDTTELIVGPAEFMSGSDIITVAPVISPDNAFVGFRSKADDLVPADTNNSSDTFLINRGTSIIERTSVSSSEVEGNADSSKPSISSDNRFVVFSSIATNLISTDTNGSEDVFVRDRNAGQTRRVSLAFDGDEGDNNSFAAVISADGEFLAFTSFAANLVANDTNGDLDIFVVPNAFSP